MHSKANRSVGLRQFVIVAHSLGGLPALQIAHAMPDRVAGFAAVGASITGSGGSFLSTLPFARRILMNLMLRAFGTRPPESAIRSGICHGLSAEQTAEIVRDFMPESVRVYTDRTAAPVPDVPKLYIKLSKDREFGLSQQDRMIANLSPQYVETLETGHLPMLSQPDELRLALTTFLSRLM